MNAKCPRFTLVFSICVGLVFAAGLPALEAAGSSQGADVKANGPSANADVSARVDALMKLSPEARRAELKKMTKEERRSLWFELKRAQLAAKGEKPVVKGTRRAQYSPENGRKVAAEKRPAAASRAPSAIGTIQYDDGVPTTTFGGGAIIGNRFDTAVGDPVLASGTVSTVVGVVAPGLAFNSSDNTAGFVIEGPQTAGGGAQAIFSSWMSGLTGTTTQTVTFSGLGVNYTGSSFFVLFGDWATSYVPEFGSGTTQSQGHHGMVGYTGGQGPNITRTFDFGGVLNGLVRVTGNVLPVELMSFDVE